MVWLGNMMARLSLFATSISSSKLVTGTQALLDDVSTAIIILDIPVTAVMCAYFWFKKTHAEDEQDDKKWNGRFKTSLVAGIVVLVISSLVNIVASYYR